MKEDVIEESEINQYLFLSRVLGFWYEFVKFNE